MGIVEIGIVELGIVIPTATLTILILPRESLYFSEIFVDAFKWSGNSEISIVNGGGIRSNLNKGD